METNEKLEKGIGTKEAETLKPVKVKIVEVGIEEVKYGSKTNEKVVLTVKHPDRDENITISKAKIEHKGKLRTSGIWYSLDEDGLIMKNSTLAQVLVYAGVEKPSQLKDKEFDTVSDDEGYLCIKAY